MKSHHIKLILQLAAAAVVLSFSYDVYAWPVPPTTVGSYLPKYYPPNYPVAFYGTGSHDNDYISGGQTPYWNWSFYLDGRTVGTYYHAYSDVIPWYFSEPGTYTVKVVYYDDDGQAGNTVTMTITIGPLKAYYYLKDHLGSVRMTVVPSIIFVCRDPVKRECRRQCGGLRRLLSVWWDNARSKQQLRAG